MRVRSDDCMWSKFALQGRKYLIQEEDMVE